MPFKSEAQRRFFYAKASEPGEGGKAFKKHLKKMRASTPKRAKLPERVKTASQDAFELGFFAEMRKIAEDSLTDRALSALPGMGALIGGTAGALHPDAFSPKEIFPKYIKRVGLRSPQGRAMSAALGAGTAATLGWLPAAMRDAYRAVKPRPMKKKDRRG